MQNGVCTCVRWCYCDFRITSWAIRAPSLAAVFVLQPWSHLMLVKNTTRLSVCDLLFVSARLSFVCHRPSMNAPVFIHVYAAIHTPHYEINTSHKLWMLYHLHTYSVSHSDSLARSGPFVVIFPWCSSRSGWHCDHGCHTTHAVFSKTAEDLLAHVTTASRLTCYHGDKPANENSADGCDVDCKLFVLRGDLFFFFFLLLPPLQLLRYRPCYSVHVHTDVQPD